MKWCLRWTKIQIQSKIAWTTYCPVVSTQNNTSACLSNACSSVGKILENSSFHCPFSGLPIPGNCQRGSTVHGHLCKYHWNSIHSSLQSNYQFICWFPPKNLGDAVLAISIISVIISAIDSCKHSEKEWLNPKLLKVSESFASWLT